MRCVRERCAEGRQGDAPCRPLQRKRSGSRLGSLPLPCQGVLGLVRAAQARSTASRSRAIAAGSLLAKNRVHQWFRANTRGVKRVPGLNSTTSSLHCSPTSSRPGSTRKRPPVSRQARAPLDLRHGSGLRTRARPLPRRLRRGQEDSPGRRVAQGPPRPQRPGVPLRHLPGELVSSGRQTIAECADNASSLQRQIQRVPRSPMSNPALFRALRADRLDHVAPRSHGDAAPPCGRGAHRWSSTTGRRYHFPTRPSAKRAARTRATARGRRRVRFRPRAATPRRRKKNESKKRDRNDDGDESDRGRQGAPSYNS